MSNLSIVYELTDQLDFADRINRYFSAVESF
jgi:hypothetical protein